MYQQKLLGCLLTDSLQRQIILPMGKMKPVTKNKWDLYFKSHSEQRVILFLGPVI